MFHWTHRDTAIHFMMPAGYFAPEKSWRQRDVTFSRGGVSVGRMQGVLRQNQAINDICLF